MPAPGLCKGCRNFWSQGTKPWCCKFGQPANKIIGHCKNVGGFTPLGTPVRIAASNEQPFLAKAWTERQAETQRYLKELKQKHDPANQRKSSV